MTKKHFIAIAAIISQTPMPPQTRNELVAKISKVCKTENPRFDVARFTVACLPTGKSLTLSHKWL
jgi:hypothetical protein